MRYTITHYDFEGNKIDTTNAVDEQAALKDAHDSIKLLAKIYQCVIERIEIVETIKRGAS